MRSSLDMLAHWAAGSRLVGLWLAVVIAAWYAPHPLTSNHEARVRFAGAILQLIGIGTVVYGMRRTRHLLGVALSTAAGEVARLLMPTAAVAV